MGMPVKVTITRTPPINIEKPEELYSVFGMQSLQCDSTSVDRVLAAICQNLHIDSKHKVEMHFSPETVTFWSNYSRMTAQGYWPIFAFIVAIFTYFIRVKLVTEFATTLFEQLDRNPKSRFRKLMADPELGGTLHQHGLQGNASSESSGTQSVDGAAQNGANPVNSSEETADAAHDVDKTPEVIARKEFNKLGAAIDELNAAIKATVDESRPSHNGFKINTTHHTLLERVKKPIGDIIVDGVGTIICHLSRQPEVAYFLLVASTPNFEFECNSFLCTITLSDNGELICTASSERINAAVDAITGISRRILSTLWSEQYAFESIARDHPAHVYDPL
ncbi:MAG: hypothetical protein LBB38_01465, partial [Puniceicoccales bacterium]|nr:hypothetical protein [Puniceicoccales bacterium]